MTNDLKIMHTLKIIDKRSYNIKCDKKKMTVNQKQTKNKKKVINKFKKLNANTVSCEFLPLQ